jgi:hypothetical protein
MTELRENKKSVGWNPTLLLLPVDLGLRRDDSTRARIGGIVIVVIEYASRIEGFHV